MFFCYGQKTGKRHNGIPIILFVQPRTKHVRRGVCKHCGQVYVSIVLPEEM